MLPLCYHDEVISVSSLNRLARQTLESTFPAFWIGGEVSNLTIATSGHAYFSLKDAQAQVRCILFRHKLTALAFELKPGLYIELKGSLTLYEARGDFQINVETLRAAGLGHLFAAYEKLKATLTAEGLFASARKRALPRYPTTIGIVTSDSGAALHDVVCTLKRRMPPLKLIVYPTQVQGEGAAQNIITALHRAQAQTCADVLIICRGGGSIEDLWAFNDEHLVRAIAHCRIPIISGIGHETDFTLSDFAVDIRAPTPTAAAELACPNREDVLQRLAHEQTSLLHALARTLTDKTQALDRLALRLIHPRVSLQQNHHKLARLSRQLDEQMCHRLTELQWTVQLHDQRLKRAHPSTATPTAALQRAQQTLQQSISLLFNHHRTKIKSLSALLDSLNPATILKRGYAIIQNQQGHCISTVKQLKSGEQVKLQLQDGRVTAEIR